jgi:hypothetical protein
MKMAAAPRASPTPAAFLLLLVNPAKKNIPKPPGSPAGNPGVKYSG